MYGILSKNALFALKYLSQVNYGFHSSSDE